MKNLIRYYRFLLIFLCFNGFVKGDVLKPVNKNIEIIKITDENKKTRTYYHLKKDGKLIFNNLDKVVNDTTGNYSIKIITRAKISPNSNSNKTFGVNLNILENGIERNKILKYKKSASSAKKTTKSGFNYTQAGFWFEEFKNIKDAEILIYLVEGSPELDVRLVINKIDLRISDELLTAVNKEKIFKVLYKKELSDSNYIKSKGWHKISNNNNLQFKIRGPERIRIISRGVINDSNQYGFFIRENGQYMSEYLFNSEKSKKDAHFIESDIKYDLSGYNSFFFNVPEGINYYTFKALSQSSSEMLVKVQSYENKK